jgi:predicted permease
MILTLIQMMLVMLCGVGWRIFSPTGLTADQIRPILTTVIYYVFLPALILDILWSANIGLGSFAYTVIGVSGILLTLFVIWLVVWLFKISRPKAGAILLATAFPNVTCMGLPILEQTFGSWARPVAIQLDLFAAAPLVFTLGIIIARYYGEDNGEKKAVLAFLNTPPFWAAFVAVMLNINHVAMPVWLGGVLDQLSAPVVPVMLFSLGLALSWHAVQWKNVPYIIPVIAIKLVVMPLIAVGVVGYLSMGNDYKSAAVIVMAMPSMLLGIVLCDRYQLDSSLYAMAVTITTLSSLFSVPFWHGFLQSGARFLPS